jgi:catechol 2,3-dioxygenase-like lactoylglutathione lyase family enzyme
MESPGLNHIILTVGDLEKSRAFYGALLDFELHNVSDEDPTKGFWFTSGGTAFFMMPSRDPIPGDRFSENRIGLDHIAFSAPSEAALNDLAATLIAGGVDTKGVETFSTGNRYITFRDPDNIQLEYWLD